LRTAGRKRDEGRVYLQMWANSSDEDGIEPATAVAKYAQWRANMDKLLRLFDTEMTTITLREQISATEFRDAVCEVDAAIDPEVAGVGPFGRFVVECVIIDTFWSGIADVEWVSTVGTGMLNSGNQYVMSQFDGSTAPMESLKVRIIGPVANPTIRDVDSGHILTLPATTIAAGRAVTVDTDLWTIWEHAESGSYATSGTNYTALTQGYGARAPRLFGLTPRIGGPWVILGGSGLGATSAVRIQGRKRFH
jgi:hypothetical protein